VYAGLRDHEHAFEWLNKAYNQRDCQLTLLKLDPFVDGLRSDRRLADLMHRMGFPKNVNCRFEDCDSRWRRIVPDGRLGESFRQPDSDAL
jgi:hypothetical protein